MGLFVDLCGAAQAVWHKHLRGDDHGDVTIQLEYGRTLTSILQNCVCDVYRYFGTGTEILGVAAEQHLLLYYCERSNYLSVDLVRF